MSAPIFKKRSKKPSVSTSRLLLDELESRVDTSRSSDSARSDATRAWDNPDASPEDGGTETSVSDILALRQLKRSAGVGIDLQRLNEGERKKRKKPSKKPTEKSKETLWDEQLQRGGLVSASLLSGPSDDEQEAERQRRNVLGQDNFQSETGAVDVDKRMMTYIEEEMAKRRAASAVDMPKTEQEVKQAILDPNDELSKIAEQYRLLQQRPDASKDKNEEEGSVTLSASMLGSVPEWDLGIEAKIRNIEQTEMAKRKLMDKKHAPAVTEDESINTRFATRSKIASESEFRAQIAEKPSEIEDNFRFNTSFVKANEKRDKRETASDQYVADRFRQRQRDNFVKKK